MPKHNPYRQPASFPVYLDEFLRIAVGGKYKANRLKTYRDYLRYHTRFQLGPQATEEELLNAVDKIIIRERTQGMSEPWFGLVREEFLRWIALRRQDKARKAATARWRKQSP